MAVSEQFFWPHAITGFDVRRRSHLSRTPFFAGIAAIGARFRNGTRSLLETMQIGRMMSVLSELSNVQLAEVGITRSEIPQYAARLILGDNASNSEDCQDKP